MSARRGIPGQCFAVYFRPVVRRSGRFIVEFVVLSACVAVALAFISCRSSDETQYVVTSGTVADVRVVPDHVVERGAGTEVVWRAEYRVVYFVGDREYSVWDDSGLRGESKAVVQSAVPQSLPSCRVKYESGKPQNALAACP
jgi:hypothetical protein